MDSVIWLSQEMKEVDSAHIYCRILFELYYARENIGNWVSILGEIFQSWREIMFWEEKVCNFERKFVYFGTETYENSSRNGGKF